MKGFSWVGFGAHGCALRLSRLRGSIGRRRRPSLDKNAEAELRLWRSLERGGGGKVYPFGQYHLRKHPHPNLESELSLASDPRKRERERTAVVAKHSI